MIDPTSAASALWPALAHATPILLAGGALVAGRWCSSPHAAWTTARRTTAAATVTAVATLVLALATGPTESAAMRTIPAIVMALVTTIGLVLARYSRTYLDGEAGQERFAGWLLATLAGSTLVLATQHLAVLLVAWLATSLCLQSLLTFYPARPMAQLAAHKKFLVSRTADLTVFLAVVVLGREHGTLWFDELTRMVANAGGPSATTSFAVALIAVATLLKSAQLPFHGWLMQVMEAPTPVSALLHAGVVNLGGYIVIRFGELFGQVPAAQALLVIGGATTAALAAVTMTTRVSVKVGLAWSTCAQMGFMLVQCGLGLYGMALLHLVVHSIYKAHGFLSAGSRGHQVTADRRLPRAGRPSPALRTAVTAGVVGLMAFASDALGASLFAQPAVAFAAAVTAYAATSLLPGRGTSTIGTALLLGLLQSAAMASVWLLLHHGIEQLHWMPAASAPGWLVVVAAAPFAALLALDLAMHTRWTQADRLRSWFFGGMHLDEWFTRMTLRAFAWQPRRAIRSSNSTETSRQTDVQ
jgi:NAD(P)H-quinone oxidoreductase subunit 5